MMRTIWSALLLSAVLTAPLAAQTDRSERVRAVFPEATAERIEALIEDATRRGLPSEPLYDKALEGAAKHIPGDRVLGALSVYSERLTHSRALLGAESPAAAIVAGADALLRGVPDDVVGRVGSESGARAPVALVVLGDLHDAGVPTDRALEAVRQALRARQNEEDMLAIPAAVRRLLRDGRRPGDAAREVTDAMRHGVSPRRIRDRPTGRSGGTD